MSDIPYDDSSSMPQVAVARRWSPHLLIAIIGSIAIVVIALTARVPTYRVSPVFLVPLLWLGYALRDRLAITPFTYAAFLVAILLHDLGAYGFYQHSPLGFSWDILVHYYFAIPAALIFRGALSHHFPILRPWQVNVTTLLFVMGVGALHEIMEYMSYLVLGESKGMLKPTTSYFFDTQRDLTNNLLGCLTALVGNAITTTLTGHGRVHGRGHGRDEKRRGFDGSVREVPHQK